MTPKHRAWWMMTGLAFVTISWIALGHRGIAPDSERLHVTPFKELFNALACVMSHCQSESSAFRLLLINGIGNIVVFVPLGATLYGALITEPAVRMRPIALVALIGFLVSATFEIIQIWIPGRVVALDDVILNTGGAISGAAIASLVHRVVRTSTQETALPL